MRKLSVCLFYGLCVFTIVFSLFWMALPKLPLSQSPAGSETDPASPLSLAAQAVPQTDTARYCLQDSGGRVAVYTCRADGTPGTLIRVTGIYTNLLPENDALRIKRGACGQQPPGTRPAAGGSGGISIRGRCKRCAAASVINMTYASISSSGTRYSLRHCSYSSI